MAGSTSNPASTGARRSKWSTPVATRRARIEIIPLIDVMFFLLASFMMVSLSLQKAGTFRMDLPVATTAARDFQPGQLNIGIEADGQVSVEKRRMDLPNSTACFASVWRTIPRLRSTSRPIAPHGMAS